MGRGFVLRRFWIAAAALAVCAPAFAGDVVGEWARADGKAKVRIAPCGGALCGMVTWLKDPSGPGRIGQRVFYDMKPNGANAWAGTAFNPEDGKEYTGKMSLEGANLTTAGCILGGWICKSFSWSRTK